LLLSLAVSAATSADDESLFKNPINVNIPHISTDPSIKYDYPIVYVRALRAGDKVHKRYYTDFSQPVTMEPGADLMLLQPDGKEELLVAGGNGSITDPMVSFDGQWVYYVHIYDLRQASQWSPPRQGADIFKIHVPSRRIVRLTNQRFSPNTGMANWSSDHRKPDEGKSHFDYGAFNMGPCPLPGGRIVFTTNRDGFRPAKGYPAIALQLFVMDDRDTNIRDDEDPANLEKIGHLNISGALHPVVLKDGRIMYSTLESQGIRGDILWGIWTIHPDGTNWAPLVSAFDPGGAPNGFHFQTQLTDASLVIEQYYNQNNSGFGALVKLPCTPPDGYPAFGPAAMNDSRNKAWRYGRFENGRPKWFRMPFMPTGSVSLTPFSHGLEGPADESVPGDQKSPKVGKFTHPSGAPDNHLLTVYSPGPVNHQYTFLPQLDGGIYLVKNGDVVEEPAHMRLIKNDPNYNECWPRALVPYNRIYGVNEPKELPRLVNDGKRSPHLPEGTPFGLVGTSSFYKRESFPNGRVADGQVTATFGGRDDDGWRGLDAFTSHGNGMPLNWHNQGADAGLYANDEIHAVRVLAMEPTTDRHRGPRSGRLFHNHAKERLRILGEIPLRRFRQSEDGQIEEPRDPDGNPDTSFLAKIPADTAFTFQTLDRNGLVLNMAQTWHQLRPGEIRTDCGGCHAHSQQPTDFNLTLAAKPDYRVWDLVNTTPLVTDKSRDQSKKRWDAADATGLRSEKTSVVNVEYHRDIKPILARSCVACHTAKEDREPAGNLNLDADTEEVNVENTGKLPGTYARLAADERAKFGHKPIGYDSWGYPNASRYVRMFQSRRSLLAWKIFGRRLDGFSNDDHPSESKPGSRELVHRGQNVAIEKHRHRWDLDFAGSVMPPPDAVKDGKVKPLSDEDRRTIVRWIDLGCPIDLDFDAGQPEKRGYGWMADDNRPIVSITYPQPGANPPLSRLVVGLFDYYSGIDTDSLQITADTPIDGAAAGENLAARFKPAAQGVLEWKLADRITSLPATRFTVSVADKQGNIHRVERQFSVGASNPSAANATPAADADKKFPYRVHVFEDYETEIERRWWLRGKPETENLAPSLSAQIPNTRACRATETKDFDDKMGDPKQSYKAVIFNPVPGPPMGKHTRLSFRYWLKGTDTIRVQIYSLSNNYHRRLQLKGLPQERWDARTVDMTTLRRPDGSGGTLSENERIDDIQFYIDPAAELVIDDIVLYDAAPTVPAAIAVDSPPTKFPARIIFTGWFDTGKQGQEWPGAFDIVAHQLPRTWKAARAVADPKTGNALLRINLRGHRPVGPTAELSLNYSLTKAATLAITMRDSRSRLAWTAKPLASSADSWTQANVRLSGPPQADSKNLRADELIFATDRPAELLVDDVLLYEPAR
jgi:hypothetical protein